MKPPIYTDEEAALVLELVRAKVHATLETPRYRFADFLGHFAARFAVLDKGELAGTVIVEPELHDGAVWWHLSVSRVDRIPTWAELVEAKELFLSTTSAAVQVVPRRSEYVNINPNVLHLWTREDGTVPLPDFRHYSATAGSVGL